MANFLLADIKLRMHTHPFESSAKIDEYPS